MAKDPKKQDSEKTGLKVLFCGCLRFIKGTASLSANGHKQLSDAIDLLENTNRITFPHPNDSAEKTCTLVDETIVHFLDREFVSLKEREAIEKHMKSFYNDVRKANNKPARKR